MMLSWKKQPPAAWAAGFALSIGLGASYGLFGNLVVNLVSALTGVTSGASAGPLLESSPGFWILVMVVIAPVLEELLFRKLLYGACRKRLPAFAAALVTSVLFGVLHLDLLQGLYAFVFSLFLCMIAEETCNWYFCAAAHFAANLLAVLLALFAEGSGLFEGIQLPWILASAAALAVFAVLIFRFGRGLSRAS